MNKRNTGKEKVKRNKEFPYKRSKNVNYTERYAIVYSDSKEIVIDIGVKQTYRLLQTAYHRRLFLQNKLGEDLEIIDFQKKE